MTSYSINDLEKITGIKAHTIRIWEKRYNVVCPQRTPTNIRFYEDCDIKKLLNIGTLNRNGFKISHIVNMPADEINEKILEITSKPNDYESQISKLTVSMIELNEEAFEKTLSTATLKLGFEKTVIRILFPFLQKVGVLWQVGTINPAQEHFISNLIRQKLILAIDGQGYSPTSDSPTFLLYLPENELHELSLLFYYYLLKKNGNKVIYLGQSVPFEDLVQVMDIRKADKILTCFMTAKNSDELSGYVNKLAEQFKDKTILITGLQIGQLNGNIPDNVRKIKNAKEFRDLI